jgi:hypothetical protein
MTTPILDPTVPQAAADWLESPGVRWVRRRPGDGIRSGCLHTALLQPCAIPGDNAIWHVLERTRGHSEEWNDRDERTKAEVLAVLRSAPEPTEDEITALFGPQWLAIRDLARRGATLTDNERRALNVHPLPSDDAASVARIAAACAGRPLAHVRARDAVWSSSGPPAAPAAPAAASALVVRDLIGQHGFTADDYRALTARWASVVGPVHPDDVRDGLVAS